MTNLIVIAGILALMAVGYQVGLGRSRSVRKQNANRMHSLPSHYGMLVALWCGIPALIVLGLWTVLEPRLERQAAIGALPTELVETGGIQLENTIRRVENIASGFGVANDAQPYELVAAEAVRQVQTIGTLAMIAVAAAAAVLGLLFALRRIRSDLRARNEIEIVVRLLLLVCSGVAILTTIGIVLSMLSEAIRFFSIVPAHEFFFGTVWNPAFSSTGTAHHGDFGLLPLLTGTLMIAAIAMLVAVPIGLMTAIYMSEYAGPKMRAFAKPVIEVLAGIPTIVYGFFALTAVGPFFASVGAAIGLEIRATSALTAGFVMGIMIIPFISSLSDDIITQVPRAMRDGSLGLGATRSETIKRVLLPAALPGIVGAFLLAVSRAIGETMIVVLAAGNSPILQFNPFEAVSTVTVTIVNQLTGDTDFASPQSLVAFALGLTLFVMTLGLNVVALYIVRKYREQYE